MNFFKWESQVPIQTHWTGACVLTRAPNDFFVCISQAWESLRYYVHGWAPAARHLNHKSSAQLHVQRSSSPQKTTQYHLLYEKKKDLPLPITPFQNTVFHRKIKISSKRLHPAEIHFHFLKRMRDSYLLLYPQHRAKQMLMLGKFVREWMIE